MARPKKDEFFMVDIDAGRLVYISDMPSAKVNNPPIMHHAKVLNYIDGIMTLAFCVRKTHGLQYREGSEPAVSYVELKDNYLFHSRILNIRARRENDPFSIGEMGEFLDDNLYSYDAYDVYMVELVAIGQLHKHQRRAYYRSKIGVDIYYKPVSENEVRENDPKMRFANQDRAEEKKKAEQGFYESALGYGKLKTVDISAGGFKFLSPFTFKENTHLDCMIMLEYEAVPVIAKVLECIPAIRNRDSGRLYQVRCFYEEINDAIRDKVMKFIVEQDRKVQKRLSRR